MFSQSLAFMLRSIGIATLTIVALWLLQPEWLVARASLLESAQPVATLQATRPTIVAPASYADAVEPAAAAVVNILYRKSNHTTTQPPTRRSFPAPLL